MKTNNNDIFMDQDQTWSKEEVLTLLSQNRMNNKENITKSMRSMMILSILRYFNELIRRDPKLFHEVIEQRTPVPLDHRWHSPSKLLNDDPDVDIPALVTKKSTNEMEVSIGPLGLISGLIQKMASMSFPGEKWTTILHTDDNEVPKFVSMVISHQNGSLSENFREEDLVVKQESVIMESMGFTVHRVIDPQESEEDKKRVGFKPDSVVDLTGNKEEQE